MRRVPAACVAVPGLAMVLLLAGCGLGIETPLQLLTNRAEMAAYVDRFNSLQSDVKVEISYQENPSQAVLDGATGDIVIGQWLSSPSVKDHLEGLGDIVKPGKIDPSWFYARLLAMGARDNRPVLIPLSFSLPAIVYERQGVDLPAMFMPMDSLQSMSKAFLRTSKTGTVTSMGFSPSWNPDFLTLSALLSGAHLRPGRNGLPAWDDGGLSKTVELTRNWLDGINGGADTDAAFSLRNLVMPWYKLLSTGKTQFALVSFRDFFALPDEERRDFDFRWMSQDGIIPVPDDVLFAGVLRSSRDKAGAKAFLQWFCSLPVQLSMLSVNQSRRIGVFAITDGFPAWKSIDEKDLPARYPLLLGHIPQENLLLFPETLPDNWVKIRDGVVDPWILDAAAGKSADTLEKRLEDWQSSQKK